MIRLKNLLFEQESDISGDLWNSIFHCYFIQIENCYFSSNPSIFYEIFTEWTDVFQIQKQVLPSSSFSSLYPDSTVSDQGRIGIFIGSPPPKPRRRGRGEGGRKRRRGFGGGVSSHGEGSS